jgi:GNAT superfamily N-acetyltransferase
VAECLPALPPGNVCLVAVEEDESVIGFVTVTADGTSGIGHIHNLAVDPSAHSKGTGRLLIEASHRWMIEQGMEIAKIDTLQVNAVGRWLYPSAGYEELVREINYAMPLPGHERTGDALPANLAGLSGLVERMTPP